MKVSVEPKELLKLLKTLSKAIPARPVIAVTANFLVKAKGENLHIMASTTSYALFSTYKMPSAALEDGEALLDARRLMAILGSVPNDNMFIITGDGKTTVQYSCGKMEMPTGGDTSLYPVAKTPEKVNSVTLLASQVLSALNAALPCAAVDTLRPVLRGVCFDFTAESEGENSKPWDSLTLVGTDTHLLGRAVIKGIKAESAPIAFNLPLESCYLLQAMLQGEDSALTISWDDKRVRFTSAWGSLISAQTQGKFPPYDRVIPLREQPHNPVLNTADFKSCVRRVALATGQEDKIMVLNFKEGKVELSANDSLTGNAARESVECEYTGEDAVIGFNADTLLKALSLMGSEKTVLHFSDPSHPMLLQENETKENFPELTILAMPMQIPD